MPILLELDGDIVAKIIKSIKNDDIKFQLLNDTPLSMMSLTPEHYALVFDSMKQPIDGEKISNLIKKINCN